MLAGAVRCGRGAPTTAGSGATALFIACFHGQTEIVTTLIAANASVNQRDNEGFTPLYAASERGHTEVVTALLAATAIDVNARNPTGDGTPLIRHLSLGWL